MSKRGRKFRLGRHWVTDEKTGFAEWDDNIVRDWDGVVTRRGLDDGEHPQWRVRSLQDPYPVELVRPERGINIDKICGFLRQEYVPRTTIKRQTSIQDDLFRLPGIGEMTIGNASDKCGYWFVVGPAVSPEIVHPQFESSRSSFSGPTISHLLKLSDNIHVDDRIIAIISSTGSVTFNWPSGWNPLFSEDNSNVSLSAAYNDVGSNEGFGTELNGVYEAGNQFFVSSSSEVPSSHISYVLRGHVDKSVAPEISTISVGNNTSPDPESISPSSGTNYLSIAVEAHNTGSTDTIGFPDNYINIKEQDS